MGLVPGVDSSRSFESMDCSSRVEPGAVTVTDSVVASFCAGSAAWVGSCGAAGLADGPCGGAELEDAICCGVA